MMCWPEALGSMNRHLTGPSLLTVRPHSAAQRGQRWSTLPEYRRRILRQPRRSGTCTSGTPARAKVHA